MPNFWTCNIWQFMIKILMLSKLSQRHAFHLVDVSAMPLLTAFSSLILVVGGTMFFHGYLGGFETTIFGMVSVLTCMFLWWRDVIREGTLEGNHTDIVQLGLRYGMLLFIASEVMFFFAFFWAFFASSLTPPIEIGNVWPPKGIDVFNAFEVPLLNTMILLCSGATITYSHHAITAGRKAQAIWSLLVTIILAVIFTGFQGFEYTSANFNITDSIYGSTFYLATGFHGLHVFIGTVVLIVCLIRMILNHYTRQHHFGFEAGAFYWHFVDVVWLFLYVAVYFWGGA
jgi:cytochrome c oxidase subunit 3